jgi:hypothetical protein
MRDNRKKCLICKEPMARWVYGMPTNYEAIKDDLLSNRIILGGCCIVNDQPKWGCQTCCISYRKDGMGYLDSKLIDTLDFKTSYQLPEKFKQILSEDFLAISQSEGSVGFRFHQGGYDSDIIDIHYMDGILIYNQYKSLYGQYCRKKDSLNTPQIVHILPKKLKVKLDTFITTSKWKKNYTEFVFDGLQWEMTRVFQSKKIKSNSFHVFPEVYKKFFEILEECEVFADDL